MAFAHLHLHTEYSLLDGITHSKDMVARAAEGARLVVIDPGAY